jgi:hypothetical protein
MNALYSDPGDAGYNPAAGTVNTINDNHVASAVYFNLNGSWSFGTDDRYQVFAQANNVQPRATECPAAVLLSNPVYFDLIGRTYNAGVRFQF